MGYVVSFSPEPLYSRWKNPGIHRHGCPVGHNAALNALEKRKISFPNYRQHDSSDIRPLTHRCSSIIKFIHFSKSSKQAISWESARWESRCSMRTDRQRDGWMDGRIVVGNDKNCTRLSYRLCESACNESHLYLRVHKLKEKCRFEDLKSNDYWNLLWHGWPQRGSSTSMVPARASYLQK